MLPNDSSLVTLQEELAAAGFEIEFPELIRIERKVRHSMI